MSGLQGEFPRLPLPAFRSRGQNSPSITPSGLIRIASALGTLESPGIVMISPASATTKPAPAEGVTSRMVIRNPAGRPSLVGSSEKEYWFFAMQTGVLQDQCGARGHGQFLPVSAGDGRILLAGSSEVWSLLPGYL